MSLPFGLVEEGRISYRVHRVSCGAAHIRPSTDLPIHREREAAMATNEATLLDEDAAS